MEYQLVNLNLGKKPAVREFSVGPFHIKLVPDYDDIQDKLSSLEKTVANADFIDGEIVWKEVEKHEAKLGESHVTATVTIDVEPEALLSLGGETGIWDLCLIFSFLSGHRIFLPDDSRRYQQTKFRSMVVVERDIPAAAELAWQSRAKFKTVKELRTLWFFLHMNDNNYAEVMLLIGCVVLEIIANLESDKSETISAELEELLENLKNVIVDSTIDDETKGKLKGAMGNWGSTSLSELFKQFMVKQDYISDDIDGIPLKRIKGINSFRNGVVHEGLLRLPNWIDDERNKKEVTLFISVMLIPAIIENYLSHKFELSDFYWVKQTKILIKGYISSGKWGEDDIDNI